MIVHSCMVFLVICLFLVIWRHRAPRRQGTRLGEEGEILTQHDDSPSLPGRLCFLSSFSVIMHGLGGVRSDLRQPSVPVALGAAATAPVRWLNLHEHISLDIMRQYGVPVPRSKVAFTPDEAEAIYEEFQKDNSA